MKPNLRDTTCCDRESHDGSVRAVPVSPAREVDWHVQANGDGNAVSSDTSGTRPDSNGDAAAPLPKARGRAQPGSYARSRRSSGHREADGADPSTAFPSAAPPSPRADPSVSGTDTSSRQSARTDRGRFRHRREWPRRAPAGSTQNGELSWSVSRRPASACPAVVRGTRAGTSPSCGSPATHTSPRGRASHADSPTPNSSGGTHVRAAPQR